MVVSIDELTSEELDSLEELANSTCFKLILESSSEQRYVPRTLFISYSFGTLYVGPGDKYELNHKVTHVLGEDEESDIERLVEDLGENYVDLTLTNSPRFKIYKNKKDFLRKEEEKTHYHREILSDDFLDLREY